MSGRSRAESARARLRVLFVNRYYAPDLSATSQMLTDIAEALARSGIEVGIVCSRQLYEDAHALLPRHEVIEGVKVWRVASARFGRDQLLGRAFDYLSFYLMAAWALLGLARSYDVLVTKTDPPLLSLLGSLVGWRRRIACVNWLQDVFPEAAARIGGTALPPVLVRALTALRDRSLRHARMNVVLGERMREHLMARGVPPSIVSVGENWADESTVRPLAAESSALRRRLAPSAQFVVAYSGNLGRAHDAATLLTAIETLRDDPATVFLMIGGGVKMQWLEGRVREGGLTQVRFERYQPRAALADTLAAGDVHLISLLPQLEGLILPSKFYGILAAGRPVVFIGDADGELARLIRGHGLGVAIACGEGAELARALRELRDAREERLRMGERARALFEERYTLRAASVRWRGLLMEAAANPERSAATQQTASRQSG